MTSLRIIPETAAWRFFYAGEVEKMEKMEKLVSPFQQVR